MYILGYIAVAVDALVIVTVWWLLQIEVCFSEAFIYSAYFITCE